MKMKSIVFSAAFALAVVGAFAGANKVKASYASFNDGTGCTNSSGTVNCEGGPATCTISGVTYYSNTNCVTTLKKS